MIIGVGLDQRLRLSLGELSDLAEEANRLGFASMWTPSVAVPEAFHVCSAWSQRTSQITGSSIRTGIGVIPAAKMWKLESLANNAATLGQISGGNFVLGLGTGGAGVDYWSTAGLPDRPIAIMRDYVTVLRALLAGEEVTYSGPAISVDRLSLGARFPKVPVYLAALGPQMLRLAGHVADGASLNWATPAQIAWSSDLLTEAAASVGRQRDELTLSMYIRVCVDEDVDAARRAFAMQVLGYGLARPGVDPTLGYRGHFGRMGFEEVFGEIEKRRDSGTPVSELVDLVPDELLHTVGYFGTPEGAARRFAALSVGLDETIVRVISAGRGVEPVLATMEALSPANIRAA